ncbi:hypothetical protein DL96DRAFT_1622924 [Flagelloscypha sp. PMI_526]|nr:hypothetical protein DL96DRAFT_1622924 [Flagelloscypha sp. PMI_526]
MAANFDSKEVSLSSASLPNYNQVYPAPQLAEQQEPSRLRRILRGSFWILFILFVGFHIFPYMFALVNRLVSHHSDITVPSHCAPSLCGIHEGLGSSTTFQLPLDAKGLFLESEGSGQGGRVTITSSKDVAKDVALVYVTSTSSQFSSVQAKVCRTERNGEHGVGIYSPRFVGWSQGMKFDVKIVFPEHVTPTLIKALAINMRNYEIDLSLGDSVSFETLDLTTTNSKITSNGPKLYVSKTLKVKSTNGGIYGNFNSSHTLDLETTNGPIEVNVILNSKQHSSNPTSAFFKTTNGRIVAFYDLVSADSTGGSFVIQSRTTNNKVSLDITKAPLDSAINIFSETTNSPSAVSLETSNATPEVNVYNKEDPSGRGRERIDQQHAGKSRGNIHVKSTNAKVTLKA